MQQEIGYSQNTHQKEQGKANTRIQTKDKTKNFYNSDSENTSNYCNHTNCHVARIMAIPTKRAINITCNSNRTGFSLSLR
jgi:hypothetical protein